MSVGPILQIEQGTTSILHSCLCNKAHHSEAHTSLPSLVSSFVHCLSANVLPSLQISDDISVIGISFPFRLKGTLNLVITPIAHCPFYLHPTESVCISMSWSRLVMECEIKLRHNTYPSSIPAYSINFV